MYIFNLLKFIGIDILQTTMSVTTLYLFPSSSYMKKIKHYLVLVEEMGGITEGEFSTNRKHVCFFAYDLRMERSTVLILTSMSAQCQ